MSVGEEGAVSIRTFSPAIEIASSVSMGKISVKVSSTVRKGRTILIDVDNPILPITDLAEYYLDHDFDPDNFDFGFNEFLLNYTNRSYSHGFWTYLVKFMTDLSKNSANVKTAPCVMKRSI